MYVVDPNDASVLMPPGAKGEICIGEHLTPTLTLTPNPNPNP